MGAASDQKLNVHTYIHTYLLTAPSRCFFSFSWSAAPPSCHSLPSSPAEFDPRPPEAPSNASRRFRADSCLCTLPHRTARHGARNGREERRGCESSGGENAQIILVWYHIVSVACEAQPSPPLRFSFFKMPTIARKLCWKNENDYDNDNADKRRKAFAYNMGGENNVQFFLGML